MSKHDHDDCQHELDYCEQHDVAYCSKCDEEWAKWEPCTLSHDQVWVYPSTAPYYPLPTWTATTTTSLPDTNDYTVSYSGDDLTPATLAHADC